MPTDNVDSVREGGAEPIGPLIVTGLSGSGKSLVSRSFEDLGYRCVDNIPIALLPSLFENVDDELEKLVVVVDVRTEKFTEDFPGVFAELSRRHPTLKLVFVEASAEVLLRRFSVARRPHPLAADSLRVAIESELESLGEIRYLADVIIDTSHLNPHELRRKAIGLVGVEDTRELMRVHVESFSYLHGTPPIASLAFDVRYLPNPYFVERLRPMAGDEPEVVEWLERFAEVSETLDRLSGLVLWLLPRYAEELKTHLTIGVGCTGGRHRSVYVADRLAARIEAAGYRTKLHHRDSGRWR